MVRFSTIFFVLFLLGPAALLAELPGLANIETQRGIDDPVKGKKLFPGQRFQCLTSGLLKAGAARLHITEGSVGMMNGDWELFLVMGEISYLPETAGNTFVLKTANADIRLTGTTRVLVEMAGGIRLACPGKGACHFTALGKELEMGDGEIVLIGNEEISVMKPLKRAFDYGIHMHTPEEKLATLCHVKKLASRQLNHPWSEAPSESFQWTKGDERLRATTLSRRYGRVR